MVWSGFGGPGRVAGEGVVAGGGRLASSGIVRGYPVELPFLATRSQFFALL